MIETLPINDSVEFYVHVGTTPYFSTVRPQTAFDILDDDAISLGGGVDFGCGNRALRLDARYFNGTSDETGTLLTAGASYRF